MKAWKLDTGNDGFDEFLFGEDLEEVKTALLAHHELAELPAHWSLDGLQWEPRFVEVYQRIHDLRSRESHSALPQQSAYEQLEALERGLNEAETGEDLDHIHSELDVLESVG